MVENHKKTKTSWDASFMTRMKIFILSTVFMGIFQGHAIAVEASSTTGSPPSSEVLFFPENPTSEDVISITARFLAGPFVETQYHSIDGNEIHVTFVQDGLDFSPNPPHEATEVIGRLPAGHYTIFVTVLFPGVHETTTILDLVVAVPQNMPQAIPGIGILGVITLVVLLLLIGLPKLRAKISTGLLSLALVFSFLQKADAQTGETGNLYILLGAETNVPSTADIVGGWHSNTSPLTLSTDEADPVSVRYLLPIQAKGDFASRLAAIPDSPRAKLERMIVVEYPTKADMEAALSMLRAHPYVEAASAAKKFELSSSGTHNAGTANYGWSVMNIPAAWQLAGGHAFAGIVDTGLATNHPELRAFNSSGFVRGNFLPANSLDVGRSSSENIQVDGDVDERKLDLVSPYSQFTNGCLQEPDDTGRVNSAGHGTHVASLIAGNAYDGNNSAGVCKNCGIGMWRIVCATRVHTGSGPIIYPNFSSDAVAPAITFLGDIGAQVINLSLGASNNGTDICASPGGQGWDMAICTALEYVSERDVAIVGASGNHRTYVQFPASDERVVAAGGIDEQLELWDESPGSNANCPYSDGAECGSNWTFGANAPKQEVVAQARQVYSAMYPGFDWNTTIGCGDSFNSESGYGPCTGTSMSAPQISGIIGILRSVNPLVPTGDPWNNNVTGVRDVLAATTFRSQTGQTWDMRLGYGIPDARAAVQKMLGTVGGETVKNRLAPLFGLYSSANQDHAYTTSPQTAIALIINEIANYTPLGSLIPGYPAFPSDHLLGPTDIPRANTFVLTTEYKVFPEHPDLVPLFLLDHSNANNRDFLLATSVAELEELRNVHGYDYRGIEGYVYERCTPEPSCIPEGAEKLWRKCSSKALIPDCAIFLESERATFEANGYISTFPPGFPAHIGYAYPNVDSDGDGLIDGFEYLIGTDPTLVDTDGDGTPDGVEFPQAGVSVSDPCDGPQNHRCRVNRVFANRFEDREYTGPSMSASSPMSRNQACAQLNDQLEEYEQRLTQRASELNENDSQGWQQYLEEIAAVEEIRERLNEYCE